MKNYEKAYKEALERAREFQKSKDGLCVLTAESIFPELRDSKDERIRKALIDYFDDAIKADVNPLQSYGTHPNKVIDWLEKQKAMDKDIIFRPLAGTDIIAAANQAIEKIEIGKEVVLAFNGAYIPVNGKTVAEICNEYFSWVEKQGEQKAIGMKSSEESLGVSSKEYNEIVNECLYGESKPTDKVEPKFKVGDIIINIHYRWDGKHRIREITDGKYIFDSGSYIGIKEQNSWELADKVEPKFKVGDWIIDKQGIVHQIEKVIENVTNNTFGYDLVSGGYFNEEVKSYRLWTIADAKDGNVLYSLDSNRPFIYKERNGYEQATAYCGLNIYGKFFVWGTKDCVITLSNYIPATKEQRDTLLKAMADAGYTFDFEKKELKLLISNGGDFESNNSKQNPTWSEDDERIVTALMEGFRYHQLFNPRFGEVPNTEIISWIKSLKERLS